MKIALLIITFVIGVAGWLKPNQTPTWLNITVVCALIAALIIEIVIDVKADKESRELKETIDRVHASETARPELELSVNGQRIEKREQRVSLEPAGANLKFELTLRNVGSAGATDVQAFLWVPEDLRIPFLGKHWIPSGNPAKPGVPGDKVAGVIEYVFVAPASIAAGNWMVLGHGQFPMLPEGMMVPLRLKVYASGDVFQEWTFGVRR